MSGVKRLVQADSNGLEEPTNEELCQEGEAGKEGSEE